VFSIWLSSGTLFRVNTFSLPLDDPSGPRVLAAEKDFLLVYKPAKMHTAFLPGGGDSLAEWCAGLYPGIMDAGAGPRNGGGLLHRLDYETSGLVLFARGRASFDNLAAQQEAGGLVKDYRALTVMKPHGLAGFPPPPLPPESVPPPPPAIESGFRPYGPGRKAVRPVVALSLEKSRRRKETAFDRGGLYRTGILETSAGAGPLHRRFTLRICRGFRHQIRCHLAWAGFPIVGDALYGGPETADNILCLQAAALRFKAPATGEDLLFSLSLPFEPFSTVPPALGRDAAQP
jgi:23S rRNA pseudouridine1911/1915/1917 synthase